MSEINTVLERIKEEGYRLTKARKAVVAIFTDENCVLSSSDVLSRLAALHLKADRSTVYRELCFLVEKNIIKKIQLADHKVYYEKASAHHHHLVCTKCNGVQEIVLEKYLEEQERQIYKKKRFKVTFHSLEFYGVCGNCL